MELQEKLDKHLQNLKESVSNWQFDPDADVNEVVAYIEYNPVTSITIYFGHDKTSKLEDIDNKPWYITVSYRNKDIEDKMLFRNLISQLGIPTDFVKKLRNRWEQIYKNYEEYYN